MKELPKIEKYQQNLMNDLKELYVAITRAKNRIIFYESDFK